ncbi:transglycosylase SLT domain-containing protein [Streptomyces sp. NPDC059701]|uniref:transglycosylase SLT domain-containing protein n=1 Tax=Streptomyces sp. NPDC059701 TaxID=3346914 RepID=UPI00369BADA1
MAAISVGSVEVDVVPNTRGIRAQLQSSLVPAADQVGDEIGRIIGRHVSTQVAQAVRNGVATGGRTATPQAARTGEQAGGAFGRAFRSRLQAAMQNLPRAEVRIGESGFNADMARLRARLETLSNKRIGVDVDAATALAEAERLQEQLRRLGADHPDVNVRVDTGQAIAELEALRAEINRLDGRTANVDVDTRSAAANLNLLTTAALTLGPAILPVLPVVAAGLGAIAAAATAAAVGVGSIALVAVPAFMQMGKVMQAQKAAQDASTQASLQGGQAASQGAQKALQLAGAQQSLATAHRNAARQIAQAQQGVRDAVRDAAEANARAADQVTQAQQGLADAVQQAADRQRQAAEQVRTAEDSLADAQRDARRAQEDLNRARLDAAEQLEDLQSRLANAQLSERDALLGVEEAQQRLRQVQAAGSKATLLDQQRAQLAYDQAVQRLKDQQDETKDLAAEHKAAQKAGVEGSETVRNAQERLRDAEERVTDQQRALAKAREDAARQQVQAQRDIAEAQNRVADAQRNVARTQEDGARSVARAQEQLAQAQQSAADSVASAQRQIASASLSAAGGVDQAALAQAKYQAELAKLTPSARETFNAFLDLKSAFGDWSKSLQPAVMPIFTRALKGLKDMLPGLTPFVLAAADAVQALMDKASAELKTPFWQGFKDDLQKAVKPAIEGLGVAFGNVFKGMAGIIDAFLPHMDSISEKMGDVTGKFADWAADLKTSPDFQRFLQYSSDMAPRLGEALSQIAGAAISIASAMSPISSIVLDVVARVADSVGWIADNAPWVVRGIYLIVLAFSAWRLGMLLWQGAMLLAAGAMRAFTLISMAGPWGWIVLAVLGVVAVIYLLWTKCEWFRDAVKAVWDAIKAGAIAVKDWFAGPFARFWTETIPSWARMLKDKVLGWWNALKNGLKAGWDWIKNWVLFQVRDFFTQTVPGWGRTLRDRTVAAWNGLRDGFAEGWGQIKTWVIYPVRDFFTKTIPGWGTTLRDRLVGAFEDARDGIGTAWEGIKNATKSPINWVIKTVWNDGVVDIWKKIRDWVPGLPKLEELPLLARGGTVPAQPGVFNRPTAIVGEGNPAHPEFVIPTDPRYRGRALALWAAAGGQLMADGGILGDIVGGIKNIGGKVGGAFKSAGSFLADPGKALDGLLAKLLDPMQKYGKTGFGALALALPKAMFKGLKSLVGFGGGGGGGGGAIGGTIPKGNRLAIINQALAAAGVPPPGTLPQWQAGLNTLITRESGWNPNAINRWDINAKNGVPSQGLAQTIPPTWSAYVPASLRSRGILDPVANVAAAIRYIVSRYGNITNVQQANANRPPAGYDSGGYLQPGLNLAYNGTGRPEPVFTTAQANALTSLAARGGTPGTASFEGDLYLDSGEFLGRVRGEASQVIDARLNGLGMQAIARRRT